MKFYYSFESTPLNFHNAFYKVLSPIFIIIRLLSLLATLGYLYDFDDSGILVLSLLFNVLEIVVLSFITYGFANKKDYAWYMVYSFLGINILSSVVSATQSSNGAYAVGQIIGFSVVPILIAIYYYKRKPIFVPSEFNSDAGEKNIDSSSNSVVTKNEVAFTNNITQNSDDSSLMDKKAKICFCRKCGNKVTEDSVFCNKCGSKVNWN